MVISKVNLLAEIQRNYLHLKSNTVILEEKRKLRTERVSDAYEMKVDNQVLEKLNIG